MMIDITILFVNKYVTGRQIEGIWHTAIVAFGREYFFGSAGIQSCPPVSV